MSGLSTGECMVTSRTPPLCTRSTTLSGSSTERRSAMPKVKVNGVQMYYEISGEGEYVLQVPGAVNGHEGYAAVTPGMAKHFKVIDFDPRGYGLSDRPQQKYTFDVWAADMAGLLDALHVERAHVHGGSMGGSLAIHYAARFPDRVNGMVVSGSSAKSDHMAKYQYEVWKALAR